MSPGPLPKHPSIRTRRGSVALTQLPAGGRPGKPPPWPLPPDASLNGQHLVALAAVQRCESDITAETDGRRRRRLTRNLDAARDRAAVLKSPLGSRRPPSGRCGATCGPPLRRCCGSRRTLTARSLSTAA